MFKLCFAIALVACAVVLIEGQAYRRPFQYQQPTRSPYYQQQQYQQSRKPYYQQPFYGQQKAGVYNRNPYNTNNFYRPPVANEDLAKTISQNYDAQPDGSYQYAYETENGISAQEVNSPTLLRSGEVAANAAGSYSYTSPEGLNVLVNYEADQDGFKPVLTYSGNGAEQFINSPNPSSIVINGKP